MKISSKITWTIYSKQYIINLLLVNLNMCLWSDFLWSLIGIINFFKNNPAFPCELIFLTPLNTKEKYVDNLKCQVYLTFLGKGFIFVILHFVGKVAIFIVTAFMKFDRNMILAIFKSFKIFSTDCSSTFC